MKRYLTLAVCAPCIWASSAAAQPAGELVEGPGYKLSEGSVLHPSAGVETGFVSNVFYEETDPIASPVLRFLVKFAIASLPPERLSEAGDEPGEPPKVEFRAGVNLMYQEYLSSNDNVRAQRDLGVGADLHLVAFPKGTFSFVLDNSFTRDNRPTNFESTQRLNRDINHLLLAARFQPGGRAIVSSLRYENTIDHFESSESSFADRLQHLFGFRVDWKFLPFTSFYFDASYGLYGSLGDSQLNGMVFKQDSRPLRLRLGAATAITERTTARVHAGFGKGFYEAGEDFTGAIWGAELGFRYSPLGRLTLAYDHDFRDSIDANFFADHALRAALDQQLGLVILHGDAGVRFRRYGGIPMVISTDTRNDTIVFANASASYVYRDWLALSAEYSFVSDETDFRYTFGPVADDPSYTRHQALLGARAAF